MNKNKPNKSSRTDQFGFRTGLGDGVIASVGLVKNPLSHPVMIESQSASCLLFQRRMMQMQFKASSDPHQRPVYVLVYQLTSWLEWVISLCSTSKCDFSKALNALEKCTCYCHWWWHVVCRYLFTAWRANSMMQMCKLSFSLLPVSNI